MILRIFKHSFSSYEIRFRFSKNVSKILIIIWNVQNKIDIIILEEFHQLCLIYNILLLLLQPISMKKILIKNESGMIDGSKKSKSILSSNFS